MPKTVFPILSFVALLGTLACSSVEKSQEIVLPPFTAEDAKGLVPNAAALSKEGAEKLFEEVEKKGGNISSLLLIEDQPLTLLVMEYARLIRRDPEYLEEFRLMKYEETDRVFFPDALEIVKAIVNEDNEFVSVIHSEYITECTCTAEGTLAKGIVSFKAKDVYEGKVNYVARLTDGRWQITEFYFPRIGLGTILNQEGKWKIYEAGHFSPRRFGLTPISNSLEKSPSNEK